ncbi:DUF6191 domain-containing protein [Saccharopolyspora pogona]|uniref:DUF6191 domain-containing protein n=1 Tax=Saccharopolyspora pogona TaxID=333966 RepID=UPI00168701E3|nr:DUF6191 domain-containing protein [Saccharopolyspora pogona]
MDWVEAALLWSIPGGVLLVLVVGGYELLQKHRRKRSGTPLSAAYVDEVTAFLYGTKRMELDHRDSMSMMRDEEAQGAPPSSTVDLDRGIVILRRDDPGAAPGT